jgi:hypothetical protein
MVVILVVQPAIPPDATDDTRMDTMVNTIFSLFLHRL